MKETTTEKYIKKAVAEAKKELTGIHVSNCNLNGVEYSSEFVQAVSDVSEAIEKNAHACFKNAEALCNITKIFTASNINIEAMMNITEVAKGK